MTGAARQPFDKATRCGRGPGCDCPRCSYADGYDDARQESMGAHLATIDAISSARPPHRTPARTAMRQLADMLDKLGASTFGGDDWTSFKTELRRRTKEQAN